MLHAIQKPIQSELQRYEKVFRAALHSDNPLLSAALTHITRKLGKMMRPTLLLLCAREAGEVCEAVLHAAAGLELLHTASLVHDDVVDESDMRRGQRSANAVFGNKAAVLVGDFITSTALREINCTGSIEAVGRTAWLGQQLADGELMQLNNTQQTTFDEAAYYDVIDRKTAALFATCARLGAFLGGADGEKVEQLSRFGYLVGRCFQMRDDLFDFDETVQTGKPRGNDMLEGKLTLPVLFALRDASEHHRQLALKVRALEASEQEIQELMVYTIEHGGVEYAEQEMQRLGDEALGLLQPLYDAEVRQALEQYVTYVNLRNS
jgi:octaprenyl-diphosphate synthase